MRQFWDNWSGVVFAVLAVIVALVGMADSLRDKEPRL
jgi:hypothetical protein